MIVMRQRVELHCGLTFPQANSKQQPHAKNAAVLQLFACGPVLYPLYWAARSQLGTRSFCDTRPRLWQLHAYIPFTVGQSHVLV